MITNLKWAYDNRHMCCNAISSEYTMMIMLIDTEGPTVLGTVNFIYTIPFKIKDLEFHPNSIFKFVSCGIQHMTKWRYSGGSLSYAAMEIENPKDLVELNRNDGDRKDDGNEDQQDNKEEEEDKEALSISFLTVIFVQDAIITAGDDGFIYVWDDQRISKKQKAHPDSPILSLHSTKDSFMFVSGGMDGIIIIYSISNRQSNTMVLRDVRIYLHSRKDI